MWSKCEQTNKQKSSWIPFNDICKCVQNRKERRKADVSLEEHMWPVFSYKCVLSSWMGMHIVRYKLPGQLKSAFSPATPPGSLRTDPDVRLTNEHLVPDFPPFIITWSLPMHRGIKHRKEPLLRWGRCTLHSFSVDLRPHSARPTFIEIYFRRIYFSRDLVWARAWPGSHDDS